MKNTIITIFTFFAVVGLLNPAYAEDNIRYNGSSTILKAVMHKASSTFKGQTGVKFDLKGKSTGFGIKKLLAGECDIAGGGRPLKGDEKAKGLAETKVFLDAYAFIVHKSNPINKISSEQITGILNGSISTWDELGGLAGKKIIILSPPEASAHYKNAKKIIGFAELPKNSMKVDMTPNVYKKVKSFPAAIGWLSRANVLKAKDIKILDIEHNGASVPMNQDNLSSGNYPYQQSMYFFTKGEPGGNVKKFIDFVKGDEGQKIITEAGFFLP